MDSATLAVTLDIFYVLIAVTTGVILVIAFYLLVRRAKKIAARKGSHVRVIIYRAITKPGIFLITAFTFLWILKAVPLPVILIPLITTEYVHVVYVIVAAWFIGEALHDIIHLYNEHLRHKSPNERVDNKLISFLELTVRYIIWIVALFIILALLHVNITPLITAGGFIGVGLTIAAQSILGNLFSGLILATDQPFKIGDRIQVSNYIGDVLAIGMRSCLIKTTDNQTIVIPNSLIEKDVVTNFSVPDPRLSLSIPLKVPYGTDIEWIKGIILDVVNDCTEKYSIILEDPGPKIYFQNFGQYCLTFSLSLWISNFSYRNDAIDLINSSIQKRFDEEGIKIPSSTVIKENE
ncbi:MAG: mechanosensitive ion channel family protein [Euryarchaeota archaeon]|nr:mechanosensitive ion channel family protein [Euryarchaeota archaeon]